MIANVLMRTFWLSFLLGIFLCVDILLYCSRHLTEEVINGSTVEREIADALKYLWAERLSTPELSRIKIGFRYYSINLDSDGYPAIEYSGTSYPVYEDEQSAQEYLDLDSSGNPTTNETLTKAYAERLTHQSFLLNESIAFTFFIHYFLGLIWILGFFQDLINAFKISNAGVKAGSKKSREKTIKKLLNKIETLIQKGDNRKIVETLMSSETRELLGNRLERFGLDLGRSQLAIGQSEDAIPILKRYASRFKDNYDAKVLIGKYFSENRKKARIQDMPYLLAFLDTSEDVDFMSWLAKLAIKYKSNDRRTIRGLVKICSSEAVTPELQEHVLGVLSEYQEIDDVGEEFYENCKLSDAENPQPRVKLAEAKLASGRFEEALDELEELLNLDYENQKVHNMLFTIYQLKEQLNDLFLIYSTVLQDYPDEPIAIAQQRKMQLDPSFDQEKADQNSSLSMEELLDKRKKGDVDVEKSILKKYERQLTIMFTDIQGYTAMTESQSVVETMAILQDSEDIIPPIIVKHEGVVIKKIGDAYMARFDSSDSAVMAAVQIQQAIKLNNDRREAENKITWHIRIGLNTGNVILKDGDLFGDAVNVASRVESLALVDGVFCTLATCEAVSNTKVQFIKHQAKKLKGKLEVMDLFSVAFDPNGKGI